MEALSIFTISDFCAYFIAHICLFGSWFFLSFPDVFIGPWIWILGNRLSPWVLTAVIRLIYLVTFHGYVLDRGENVVPVMAPDF
jgi:hypothetical protein